MAKKPNIQYGSPNGGVQPSTGSSKPKGVIIAVGAAIAVALIAIIVFAVQDGGGEGVNNTAFQPVTITGESLPALSDSGADPAIGMTIPTIVGKDFDGNTVELKPGEPTVVVIMAHWCAHCQQEIPSIVKWTNAGDLSSDVKVVGISTAVNESNGNFPPASWLQREAWTFPTIADSKRNESLGALGVSGYPTMIAVRADGTVGLRMSGEQPLSAAQQLWAAALGEEPSTTDTIAPGPSSDATEDLPDEVATTTTAP